MTEKKMDELFKNITILLSKDGNSYLITVKSSFGPITYFATRTLSKENLKKASKDSLIPLSSL